jgi:SAM-dependent methyltransferase
VLGIEAAGSVLVPLGFEGVVMCVVATSQIDAESGAPGRAARMEIVRFDFEETFGEDYLYFYATRLTDEQNEHDTEDVVRFLDLQPGDAVLDAPCGHGRISNRLAERGIHVVGIDASELFLDVARAANTTVDYRAGDLRDLPVEGPFDAATSWFTSFGYFDDESNRRVLSEYRRVLRPEGRLLIEMHNRDELVRRFTPAPFSHTLQIGDDLRIDTSEFDSVEGRMETDRLVIRDGRARRSHQSVRVPTITELRGWLSDAGFSSAQFTARDGRTPSIHRPRLVVVAHA